MTWDFLKWWEYSPDKIPTFTSSTFAVLFVGFYILWGIVYRGLWLRNSLLLIFSLYIYYRLSGYYVFLLIGYSFIDYAIGLQLGSEKKEWSRKLLLYTSIAINLGLLFFFKYFNFVMSNYKGWLGEEWMGQEIIAPLGISFWVFRSLSYVIDVYNEVIEIPEPNYLYYLLYLSYFPMVLSGPLMRGESFFSQLRTPTLLEEKHVHLGYLYIISGIFKKVVIADPVGSNFVMRIFENPSVYTGLECLIAGAGYGFYLYYDFSGYTDLAIGLSYLLGIALPANFREPFKSTNITEFWRRWHITLFQWFSDYIYTPLSFGWRQWGKIGIVLSVWITFLFSGLWHGANWTFIIWGLLHGFAISYEIITKQVREKMAQVLPSAIHRFISILLTYSFLTLTFFFFASPTLSDAITMINRIFEEFHGELFGKWLESYFWVACLLGLGIILHYLPTAWKESIRMIFLRLPWSLKTVLLAITVVLAYQFKAMGSIPFVYLQF